MRVLELTHNLPRFKGDFSGSFIDALCRALATKGAEIDVLAPHDRDYDPAIARPYQLHNFRYAWPSSWETVGYMRSLINDLRPRRSSLLVTPALLFFGTIAALRLIRKIKPDVIHAHWLLPNGLIGAIASRLTGVPLVVSIPGSDLLIARANVISRSFAHFTLKTANLITSNSRQLREVAYTLGADSHRFDLIIYGVDEQLMHADQQAGNDLRRELDIGADDFLVLAVGRMVAKKGFRYAVRAMPELIAQAPRAKLLFIGKGEEWEMLRQQAAEMGLQDSIIFAGTVPYNQIIRYYNAADVLVMPSVTEPEDGLNVCVIDAMSCGKPIVATDCAGNDIVVREGVNGFLVPERDVKSLAGRLTALANAPGLCHQFGIASRRLVEERFCWSKIAETYLTHFQQLNRK